MGVEEIHLLHDKTVKQVSVHQEYSNKLQIIDGTNSPYIRTCWVLISKSPRHSRHECGFNSLTLLNMSFFMKKP